MLRRISVIALVAFFLIGATVASAWDWPWAKKKKNVLTLTGSTTVLPVAQRAAEEFMKTNLKVSITVRGGGSGVGIAALVDGTTDIANASRPMKTKELQSARAKGTNPVETVVARDGIAIIVHPSNPVEKISLQSLKAVYTGEISKWSDIGGKPEPIVAVSRDVASGTFETFKTLALRGGKTRGDALMLASNKAVATTVAQTPGSIGYVGLGYLSPGVKALQVEGVSPSPQTVTLGEYKLARPLFMYTDGEPKGLAKRFIDFIMSREGQKIVSDVGFVPVK